MIRKTERTPPAAKGKRLNPKLRRAQILDAAARLIVDQGYLPLPVEQLARAAGASKALIYTYFPTQYTLFNALLARELETLSASGLDIASRIENFEQAASLSAMLYFDHVARQGPLMHILMTDQFMDGHFEPELLAKRDEFVERIQKTAARTLPLNEQEIYAAIEMVAAIPEEAGRLVFHQELDPTTARQVCNSLIASSISALSAPEQVFVPE